MAPVAFYSVLIFYRGGGCCKWSPAVNKVFLPCSLEYLQFSLTPFTSQLSDCFRVFSMFRVLLARLVARIVIIPARSAYAAIYFPANYRNILLRWFRQLRNVLLKSLHIHKGAEIPVLQFAFVKEYTRISVLNFIWRRLLSTSAAAETNGPGVNLSDRSATGSVLKEWAVIAFDSMGGLWEA